MPACVLAEIRREVEREARMFGVSKSFVIATALAHTFGIKTQEEYDEAQDRPKLRRMK